MECGDALNDLYFVVLMFFHELVLSIEGEGGGIFSYLPSFFLALLVSFMLPLPKPMWDCKSV